MKFTLKQRFWLWIYRWSKKLYYYADEKSGTNFPPLKEGSDSNYHVEIWQ